MCKIANVNSSSVTEVLTLSNERIIYLLLYKFMSFGVEGLNSFVRSIPLDVFHLINFRFIHLFIHS